MFDPRGATPALQRRHSVLGIVSLIMAACAAIGLFLLFAFATVAGVLEDSGTVLIADDSPAEIALGLGLFALMGLQLLALGLGVWGLFERERKRVCAIIGVTVSVMSLAGISLMLLIGLLAE